MHLQQNLEKEDSLMIIKLNDQELKKVAAGIGGGTESPSLPERRLVSPKPSFGKVIKR